MRGKRLADVLITLGLAGLITAGLWIASEDTFAGGGTSSFFVTGAGGLGKVADSIATASLAPGEIDTSSALYAIGCDRILLVGYADGDSFSYEIDYSPNGTDWLEYRDSTFVNGSPTAVGDWFTWGDPDTAWTSDTTWSAITRERYEGTPGLKVWHQFVHTATVGANNTVHFGGFMYEWLRLRINNFDLTDTLRSNDWRIRCEN